MLSNAKRLFTNSCFLALAFAAPASVNAQQYVLKITDAAWPAELVFGADTLLEDDRFYPFNTLIDPGPGIALGFNFPFFCNTYDEVYINANGFVTLGSTSLAPPDAVPVGSGWDDNYNYDFPLQDDPDNSSQEFWPHPMIALFWTDVVTEHVPPSVSEGNGQIWYRLDTTSSPKRLIVTWNDVFHYKKGSDGDSNTTGNNFQLILYEDGRIQFNYGTMGWAGQNIYSGREATVGIYSADHSGGACDEGSLPSMEYFPADTTVAGKQLLFLPDEDEDKIPDDGDGSGVAGDNFCSELLDWPTEPYNSPWGTCTAGILGLGCEYPYHEDCDTTPGAGDGLCEPCDVCVFCDDNCALVDNSSQLDTEFDGMGDACDGDDDNDGIPDGSDPFPLDTDNDGLDNDIDDDDDNDGILDVNDTYPLDTNNDGQDNDVDDDDDGDNLLDVNDPLPLDYNYADGDLDASGLPVNAADVLIAERITLDLETATTLHLQHGDVRPQGALDGIIDLRDVIMIMREALNPGTL
jgi:hypothetical protein